VLFGVDAEGGKTDPTSTCSSTSTSPTAAASSSAWRSAREQWTSLRSSRPARSAHVQVAVARTHWLPGAARRGGSGQRANRARAMLRHTRRCQPRLCTRTPHKPPPPRRPLLPPPQSSSRRTRAGPPSCTACLTATALHSRPRPQARVRPREPVRGPNHGVRARHAAGARRALRKAGRPHLHGHVIGECSRDSLYDMDVNPVKGKKLTNIRTTGHEDAVRLPPPRVFPLEEAIVYVAADELVEVGGATAVTCYCAPRLPRCHRCAPPSSAPTTTSGDATVIRLRKRILDPGRGPSFRATTPSRSRPRTRSGSEPAALTPNICGTVSALGASTLSGHVCVRAVISIALARARVLPTSSSAVASQSSSCGSSVSILCCQQCFKRTARWHFHTNAGLQHARIGHSPI